MKQGTDEFSVFQSPYHRHSLQSSFVGGQLGLKGHVFLDLALQVGRVSVGLVRGHRHLLLYPTGHLGYSTGNIIMYGI